MAKESPKKRMGRPPSKNPKGYVYGTRFDADMREGVEKYLKAGGDLGQKIRDFVRRLLKSEGHL